MKFNFTLQAVSAISHGDVGSGLDNTTNARLFLRTNIISDGRVIKVPTISENAIRTKIFRISLHEHLLAFLGIAKSDLKQSVTNLLFSGGNLKKGAREPDKANELGHKLRKLYPSFELLGGAVDDFILPESRLKLVAFPIATEFWEQLEMLGCEKTPEHSIFDLLSTETKTAGTGKDCDGNQMLYEYEVLISNAKFFVELTLDRNTPDVVVAALSYALTEWDGFFGGNGAKGKGRMVMIDHNLPAPDLYLEHLQANKEAMFNGLMTGDFGTGTVLCTDDNKPKPRGKKAAESGTLNGDLETDE